MKTKIYEIDDHDVLETFFGEEPRSMSIANIAKEHGDLIFEGDCTPFVDNGDVLGIDSSEKIGEHLNEETGETEDVFRQDEYVILVRYYHADTDTAILLVHQRHQVEVVLS